MHDGTDPSASFAQTADTDPLLSDLTEPQRHAVLHTRGPLLVLAAAGSGKTRVITRRIAHLLRLGTPPWSILALTFTNKAAGEMRERVMDLLEGDPHASRGLTITTFHSLCARLLRRYAEAAELPGLKPDYTIYSSADQAALMKSTIKALDLSTSNWPPRSVLSAVSAAKNDLLDAEAFAARSQDYYSRQIAKIYASYESRMRQAGALDFDDLLLLTARLLSERPFVREELQRRWQHIMIDEYQDTNHAQFRLASLLAGDGPTASGALPHSDPGDALVEGLPGLDDEPDNKLDEEPDEEPRKTQGEPATAGKGPNICVVGDPDQAIYGWRGADITNILEFEEHYPGARTIALGENFRSTEPILTVADTLIQHNAQRKHKPLFTSTPGGDRVRVTLCPDERYEADLVTDWLRVLHDGGLAWKDAAIFYRTNALSRVLEDAFRTAGIPYVIARGTAFYEREEVKHTLSYLRVVANEADDVSLARVVNVPARGLGKTSLQRMADHASADRQPLLMGLRRAGEIAGLTPRAAAAAERFTAMLDGWTGAGSFMGSDITGSLADLVARVIKESGLEQHYKKQADASGLESDAERLENLNELISSAAQFEAEYVPESDPATDPGSIAEQRAQVPPLLALLRAYLESVALVADADRVDPTQGAVTLMTLHAAKGLEFPAVAVVGLEEGLLPHSRALTSESELEEERRLCFVGITRAMRQLHLTNARYRTVRGVSERTIPSRFLEELPHEHVMRTDHTDDHLATPSRAHDASPMSTDPGDALRSLASARRTVAAEHDYRERFPVGTTVRHPQFGTGVIVTVTSGSNARATVRFAQAGTKTLVLEYARLRRLDGDSHDF